MSSTPTTTLDTAIARLCAVLRELGPCVCGPTPEWVVKDPSFDRLHHAHKGADYMAGEALIETGDLDRFQRAQMASSAAWCLATARLGHVAKDPARVEALAQMALQLLAWPEAMALIEWADACPHSDAQEDRRRAAVAAYRMAIHGYHLGDTESPGGIKIPQGPSQPETIADLSAKVRARLGSASDGAYCVVAFNLYDGHPEVRWQRVYADGVCSDQRWAEAKAETVEACLQAVLEHEDDADRKEPEHAGPPPVEET